MIKFNINIYHFFKKHKVFFYLFFVILSLIFLYFGSKVKYEEDVSKILPSTKKGSLENIVFNNIKVKDKIFILFKTTNDSINIDKLTEECDTFTTELLSKDSANHYIDNILYKIDDELFPSLISYLFKNIPIFIDSTDFLTMDSLLTKENIENQMMANVEVLSSEAGMAYYDILRNDPIGFRNTFMNKSEEIRNGFGGNYTIINNHLFTQDSTVAIAFISPNFRAFDSKNGTLLVNEIQKEIKVLQASHPDIEILFHGAPVQSTFNSKQIKKDLFMTIGISVLIILLIIGLCYKKFTTFLSLLMPILFGTFFGLTCMYFIKGEMSLLALGIGAIILAVALSYSIHVLTHFKYCQSPLKVITDQTIPLILSCITTIGAFAGLLFTKSELLKDFGLFASFTLIGATAFSLLFLPQFFYPEKNKYSKRAFKILYKINNYPIDHYKWISISIILIFIVCLFFSRKVQFDSDLRDIGYNNPEVVRSLSLLTEKTTPNLTTKYYASTAKSLDSAIYYYSINCDRIKQLSKSNTISNYGKSGTLLISSTEQQKRIDRWKRYWTEEKKAEVKKNIISTGLACDISPEFFDPFFEMIDGQYTPVSLLESDVLPKSILSNIVEYTDSTYLIFTPIQTKPEDVYKVASQLSNSHFIIIDPMFYTSNMVKIITDDFNLIALISSIFVFIILLLHFKSILLSLLAFLPMAMSWFTVQGIMGMFGIKFNIINIIISTFIFGIGVDYSIYIMDGLISRVNKDDKMILYHKTAIFFSALALVICSISLIFARHVALSSVGLITLIGMASSIITTYSLQPFIFNILLKYQYSSNIIYRKSKILNDKKKKQS